MPAPARAAQLRAVGTAFLRQRPWIVAPSLLAQAALLGTSDAPRTQLAAVLHHRRVRAGYRTDGTASNLAVVRTMRESLARRIAFAGPATARLRSLQILDVSHNAFSSLASLVRLPHVKHLSLAANPAAATLR